MNSPTAFSSDVTPAVSVDGLVAAVVLVVVLAVDSLVVLVLVALAV